MQIVFRPDRGERLVLKVEGLPPVVYPDQRGAIELPYRRLDLDAATTADQRYWGSYALQRTERRGSDVILKLRRL